MDDGSLVHDYGLQTLLDLDGFIYYMEEGKYWVKFRAWRVKPTKHIPHGIKYSLTLHDKNNARLVGYDNAHHGLQKTKRYKARKIAWDHVHKTDRIYTYGFDTASQLIEDFWIAVNEYLKMQGC